MFASRLDAQCTYCDANPLNGERGHGGTLIDHVLLRGFRGNAIADRALTMPLTIKSGTSTIHTAHSDHYGVMAELTP